MLIYLNINWSGNVGGHTECYAMRSWDELRRTYTQRRLDAILSMLHNEPNCHDMPKPRIAVVRIIE